jgi:hypothetical protein
MKMIAVMIGINLLFVFPGSSADSTPEPVRFSVEVSLGSGLIRDRDCNNLSIGLLCLVRQMKKLNGG